MAQKGYSGTEAVFEGKEGLMDAFGPEWAIDKLIRGPGKNYKILECSMKAFPTEALTHTHLSAVLKMVTDNNISHEQIEEVTIITIARACDILFDQHKYRPDSRETADHSLPYCVAAALVDHQITTRTFSDEKLKDRRIWQVIDKIRGEASQEFEEMFPDRQPSRVVIKTADGEIYEEYLEYPKGDPREPMTMGDLEAKLNALSSDLLTPDRQAAIKDMVFSCDK